MGKGRSFRLLFLMLILMFCAGCANNSDALSVGGRVVAYGEGLSEAEIFINGRSTGAFTDANGYFNIKDLKFGDIIAFAADGYSIENYAVESGLNNLIITAYKLITVGLNFCREQGSATGMGTYLKNQEVTLLAMPAYGYYFAGWFADGDFLSDCAEYVFTAICDCEIDAEFNPITFNINLLGNYIGLLSGGGVYRLGDTAQLSAAEASDARFIGWYAGETLLSYLNPYSFTVSCSLNITAVYSFALFSPQLTVNDAVVSWQAVENAAEYKIYINSALKAVTKQLFFDFSSYLGLSGKYVIGVEAVSDEPSVLNSLPAFAEYDYLSPIASPYNVGVSFDDGITLNFSSVVAACDYKVEINGTPYLLSDYPSSATYLLNSVHFKLDGLIAEPGDVSILVTALAEDQARNSTPAACAFYYFGTADTPFFTFEDGVISWEDYGSFCYSLIINGVTVKSGQGASCYDASSFAEGDYTVSLKIFEEGYLPAEYTAIITKC